MLGYYCTYKVELDGRLTVDQDFTLPVGCFTPDGKSIYVGSMWNSEWREFVPIFRDVEANEEPNFDYYASTRTLARQFAYAFISWHTLFNLPNSDEVINDFWWDASRRCMNKLQEEYDRIWETHPDNK